MSPRVLFAETFRALRIRNYRRFVVANLVSMSGTWMQTVALSWLVLTLTGSGIALGVTTGLQFLPTALAGMWGGLLADRFDKRRIMIYTNAVSGALAVLLGALTATGQIRLWHVYVLALAVGMATALDTPARQAFVIEMVGPREIANAVGLNSAAFNTARIIGPAVAAGVIAAFGMAPAFFLNAVTYVAPVIALLSMDARALHRAAPAPRAPKQLRLGLAYAWREPVIRRTLLVLAVVATLGFNFNVSIPLMARFTFGRQAGGYAGLMSVMAAGGLLGGLWAARRARPTPRLLAGSATAFGVAGCLTAIAPTLELAGATLVVTGATAMAFIATANSTLQLAAPAAMRGRVMAIYAIVFLGSTPVGGPLIGWIAEQAGPRTSVAVGALASVAVGTFAWLADGGRLPGRTRAQVALETPEAAAVPPLPSPRSA